MFVRHSAAMCDLFGGVQALLASPFPPSSLLPTIVGKVKMKATRIALALVSFEC